MNKYRPINVSMKETKINVGKGEGEGETESSKKNLLSILQTIVSPIISKRCGAHTYTHARTFLRCKHGAQRYGNVKFSFNLDVD